MYLLSIIWVLDCKCRQFNAVLCLTTNTLHIKDTKTQFLTYNLT